jgi:hypothetical protein
MSLPNGARFDSVRRFAVGALISLVAEGDFWAIIGADVSIDGVTL